MKVVIRGFYYIELIHESTRGEVEVHARHESIQNGLPLYLDIYRSGNGKLFQITGSLK